MPAELVHNLALHNPVDYVKFVTGLFEYGQAWYGKWLVEPSRLLKHSHAAGRWEEVDWVPLVSIRDDENWFVYSLSRQDKRGLSGNDTVEILNKAGYKHIQHEFSDNGPLGDADLIDAGELFDLGYDVALLLDVGVCHYPLDAPLHHHNHRVAARNTRSEERPQAEDRPRAPRSSGHVRRRRRSFDRIHLA